MKICKKCGKSFPFRVTIDGKRRNLKNRHNCLECQPFKSKPQRIFDDHKICPVCNKDLPLNEFYNRNRNGSKASYCKKCFNKMCTERWIKKKIEAILYLGGKCERCNIKSEHYSIYDFHHKDQIEKDMDWAKLRKFSWLKMKDELDKCQLLCSNCHRIVHEGIYNH